MIYRKDSEYIKYKNEKQTQINNWYTNDCEYYWTGFYFKKATNSVEINRVFC